MVSSRSGLVEFTGPEFVDLECTNAARFQLHSDESIWACITKLRRSSNSTNVVREQLEIVLGFSSDVRGILYDEWLRNHVRPTTTTYDWMHVFLVSGLAQLETWLFLASLPAGRHWPDLDNYTKTWRWPSHIKDPPKNVWDETHRRSAVAAGRIKLGASEMLSTYGIVRSWAHARDFTNSEAGHSLLSVFKVLDALASHLGPEKAPQLMRDIVSYIEAHKRAHGIGHLIPKFHMALHLPAALAQLGELPSCFVHERKHKTAKKYGTTTARLSCWERSVTSQLLNQQLDTMTECVFALGAKISGRRVDATTAMQQQFPGCTCTAAAHASCNGVHASRGDVVYIATDVGVRVARVRCHIEAEGVGHYTVADVFHKHGLVWVLADSQLVVPVRTIVSAAVWRQHATGFEVIEPPAVAWR